jgi:hypothetical protein
VAGVFFVGVVLVGFLAAVNYQQASNMLSEWITDTDAAYRSEVEAKEPMRRLNATVDGFRRKVVPALLGWFAFLAFIVGGGIALRTLPPGHTTPRVDKAAHDLQMQCAGDARAWFASATQSGPLSPKGGVTRSQFTNNYSAERKKCFVLATSAVNNPVYPAAVNTRFEVFDISSNAAVARLQTVSDATGTDKVVSCSIEQRYCGDGFTAKQWHEAIRRYSEDRADGQ